MRSNRLPSFVHLPAFDESVEGWLDDEDIRRVQQILNEDPLAGVVVPGTGGLRKLRIAASGRGKRGGARLLYLYVQVRNVIYFVAVFTKSTRENLTRADYRVLTELVKHLKMER